LPSPPHRFRATTRRTQSEGRRLAEEHAGTIADLPLRELDVYGSRREVVSADGGGRYVVRSIAYWDSEAWKSKLYVIVRVYPTRGWLRRAWPYSAVVVRAPPS